LAERKTPRREVRERLRVGEGDGGRGMGGGRVDADVDRYANEQKELHSVTKAN